MGLGKKILIAVLVLAVVAGGAVIIFLNVLGAALDENNTETVSLTIESGSGTGTIAQVLVDSGIIDDVNEFKLWSRMKGYDSQYKAGNFGNLLHDSFYRIPLKKYSCKLFQLRYE